MLERPPGGTTIRRPAGLMGMSSGVGGPARERERWSELHDKRAHKEEGEKLFECEFEGRHLKDCRLYSC